MKKQIIISNISVVNLTHTLIFLKKEPFLLILKPIQLPKDWTKMAI